jgi:hypothetical protein
VTSAAKIVDRLLENDPEEFTRGVMAKDPLSRALEAYERYTRSCVREYNEEHLWSCILKALGCQGDRVVSRLLEDDEMEVFVEPLRHDYISTWAEKTSEHNTWEWHQVLTDKPDRNVTIIMEFRIFNTTHDAWPMVINMTIVYNGRVVVKRDSNPHIYGQGGYGADITVLTKGLYTASRKIIEKCSNLNWEDFPLLERIIWNTIGQYVPEKPARS